MRLRYDDTCVVCNRSIGSGTRAWWDPSVRSVTCTACGGETSGTPSEAPVFVPGRSAQRVADRKRAKARREWEDAGWVKKVGIAWRDRPTGAKTWDVGAEGERIVGARLDVLQQQGLIIALHDIAIPGSSANVDHVAVGPSGVHIIDAKHYRDQRVELRNKGGLFRSDVRLFVGSRDKTNLVDKLSKQIVTVDGVLPDMPLPTVVTPVLCFVRSTWGFSRKGYILNAVRILWPSAMQKLLLRPGPLTPADIEAVGRRLRERLRPA